MSLLHVFPAEEYDISGNEYTHCCVWCGSTTATVNDDELQPGCVITWGQHNWVAK